MRSSAQEWVWQRLCVVAAATMMTRTVVAQAPAPESPAPVSSGAVEAVSFARYRTPGECWQAARRLQAHYWRDKRPDTVRYAPMTDSVPSPVIHTIDECVARVQGTTVPTAQLRNLAQLYLVLGRDSLARQVMARLIRAEGRRTVRDRGWTMLLWIRALLTAKPARVWLARDYLVQLDALGAPAALWRLFAHEELSRLAFTMNDGLLAESEARAAIVASRQLSTDDRVDWIDQLRGAYAAAAGPVALLHGGGAAVTLLDTMITDLGPLRPSGTRDHESLMSSMRRSQAPFRALGTDGGLQPVRANAWYGAPGDTIHPAPGRISLIMFCDGPDYPLFSVIRRLHAAYAARGLDVVFMAWTQGYFRSQPMPSPAIEADSLGHYFRAFLHLPVSVAMETTQFSRIADGRRRNEETPNAGTYGRLPGAVLIDRRGMIRWIADVTPETETVWNAVIRDAM